MTPPSWQPDPTRRHELRWWDGARFTDQVADQGVVSTEASAPWAPPTVPVPPPPSVRPPRRGRTVVGVIAVTAIVAAGIASFVISTDNSSDDSSDDTTVTSTAEAPTTSEPIVPSTPDDDATPAGDLDADVLLAYLSTEITGADWEFGYEGTTSPESQSGAGYGLCGGGNAVTRARAAGSSLEVYGPGWYLPDGSSFGVDVFLFPDEQQAQALLDETLAQANSCDDDPVRYTSPESEIDWFDDGFGDDAEWSVLSTSNAYVGRDPAGDGDVRSTVDETYSTAVDGTDYALTYSAVSIFERHGRVVLLLWSDGTWGSTGFGADTSWEYRPSESDVQNAAADVRDQLVSWLEQQGVK